jgi:hypothetical protein
MATVVARVIPRPSDANSARLCEGLLLLIVAGVWSEAPRDAPGNQRRWLSQVARR